MLHNYRTECCFIHTWYGSNVLTYPYHGLFISQLTYLLSRRKYIAHFFCFLVLFFLVKQPTKPLIRKFKADVGHAHINPLYKEIQYFIPNPLCHPLCVYFILCNAGYHDANKDSSWYPTQDRSDKWCEEQKYFLV